MRWMLCNIIIIIISLACPSALIAQANTWETLKPYCIIEKPPGNGPFPAVVLLHGSAGIPKIRDTRWRKLLVEWGFVALQVDSLRPRGYKTVYQARHIINHSLRSRDAHLAKDYLTTLPFVDPKKIAVLGWSHGGSTVLQALRPGWTEPDFLPFRAGIAFYPYCRTNIHTFNAPLLILIGAKDDWCPADLCQRLQERIDAEHALTLKLYPGAYHDFDWPGKDSVFRNHRLLFDPQAYQDAIIRVKHFLNQYLGLAERRPNPN